MLGMVTVVACGLGIEQVVISLAAAGSHAIVVVLLTRVHLLLRVDRLVPSAVKPGVGVL